MHVRKYVPTYVCIPLVSLGMHQARPFTVWVMSIKFLDCKFEVQRIFCIQKLLAKKFEHTSAVRVGGVGGGASCWEELGAVETG